MLQTIEKIGLVLDLFTNSRPEWALSDIAGELGVPRSSAHGLLSSLVETGLLQSAGRGRYRIGWRAVELSETHLRSIDLSGPASQLPVLGDETGETAHVAVLERWRPVYTHKRPGRHTISVTGIAQGVAFDAHCSAVGKVLLAHRQPLEVERFVVSRPLRRFTADTLSDPADLVDELARVRAAGVAVDVGEMIKDVCCVAAPVRDDLGVVVAAIGVTMPSVRYRGRQEALADSVVAAAAAASASLASPVLADGHVNPHSHPERPGRSLERGATAISAVPAGHCAHADGG